MFAAHRDIGCLRAGDAARLSRHVLAALAWFSVSARSWVSMRSSASTCSLDGADVVLGVYEVIGVWVS